MRVRSVFLVSFFSERGGGYGPNPKVQNLQPRLSRELAAVIGSNLDCFNWQCNALATRKLQPEKEEYTSV